MYQFDRRTLFVPEVKTQHRRIHGRIPAHETTDILSRLDKVESRSMHGQLPVVWRMATDFYVFDHGGNKFTDFSSGIFVANVGHSNKNVLNAITNALNGPGAHTYNYPTEIRTKYLELLTKWSGFDKAFLVSSGSEATEVAMKLMLLHGLKSYKNGIVVYEGNYHGRTLGAQLMSGKPPRGYENESIHVLPFPNDLTQHGEIVNWKIICGVMLETYRGWDAKFYPIEYVQALASYCKEYDILLCFDEMQSGFGRTGKKFGYEHYGVKPDLICVGKGMGGGTPLSGVLGRADIMDLPEVGEISSTHSANPLCCAAGYAVINEIERLNLVSESERKGQILAFELEKIASRHKEISISSKGLVAAILLNTEDASNKASHICELCMQKGLIVVHTGRESIKIGPPLTITDDALIEGVQVIGESIDEVLK